jgi:peptidyl-prolyl cis-trans isomerase C
MRFGTLLRSATVMASLAVCAVANGDDAFAQSPAAQAPSETGGNASPAPPSPMPPGYNPGEMLHAPADPVVADVEGHPITLAEVGDAIRALPANMREVPFENLYPRVLERLIEEQALVTEARRMRLDADPVVQRHLRHAEGLVLEDELLNRLIGDTITEQALLARYQQEYANKPGPEEVNVSAILVPTEEQARKDIAEIAKGADFATVAKRDSNDTSANKGGNLGFMKQSELVPELGAVAFSLDPGQVAPNPVHAEMGWFVVKVLARRRIAGPTFAEAREDLRHELLVEGIPQAVKDAVANSSIKRFDMNGAAPPQPSVEQQGPAGAGH